MAARVSWYGKVARRQATCSTTKEIGTTSGDARRANTINLVETETKRKKTVRYIRSSRRKVKTMAQHEAIQSQVIKREEQRVRRQFSSPPHVGAPGRPSRLLRPR